MSFICSTPYLIRRDAVWSPKLRGFELAIPVFCHRFTGILEVIMDSWTSGLSGGDRLDDGQTVAQRMVRMTVHKTFGSLGNPWKPKCRGL